MNFARDLVDCAERGTVALVELAREGERHEWTFAEVGAAATKLAGYFTAQGLRRGDIVLIWLGNRSEWVLSMLACFRLGLVARRPAPSSCVPKTFGSGSRPSPPP